jgi:hypothetical protein
MQKEETYSPKYFKYLSHEPLYQGEGINGYRLSFKIFTQDRVAAYSSFIDYFNRLSVSSYYENSYMESYKSHTWESEEYEIVRIKLLNPKKKSIKFIFKENVFIRFESGDMEELKKDMKLISHNLKTARMLKLKIDNKKTN